MLPKLGRLLLVILAGIYLFAVNNLLIIPAAQDWSIYGIVLLLAVVFLFYLSLPPGRRLNPLLLAAGFLFLARAFEKTLPLGLPLRIVAVIIITLVVWAVLYFLGARSWRRFAVLALTAFVLTTLINPQLFKLWTEFRVVWSSPVLHDQTNRISFPLQVLDLDDDGRDEILTEGKIEEKFGENREKAELPGKNTNILPADEKNYLVLEWEPAGYRISPCPPDKYEAVTELALANPINLPYFRSEWSADNEKITHRILPDVTRQSLVEDMTDFGAAPLQALALCISSLEDSFSSLSGLVPDHEKGNTKDTVQENKNRETDRGDGGTGTAAHNLTALNVTWEGQEYQVSGEATKLIGAGFFRGPETVGFLLLGTRLELWEPDGSGKLVKVNSLSGDEIPGLYHSQIQIADLDRDGRHEVLVSAPRARILAVDSDGQWQNLWVSPDDVFVFQDFTTLGSKKSEIIALTRSTIRNNSTRYLTGLTWSDGQLRPDWKVFLPGITEARAGDFDNDGNPELAIFQGNRVSILVRHNLPVVLFLYLITAGLLLFNFVQCRRSTLSGEVLHHE